MKKDQTIFQIDRNGMKHTLNATRSDCDILHEHGLIFLESGDGQWMISSENWQPLQKMSAIEQIAFIRGVMFANDH